MKFFFKHQDPQKAFAIAEKMIDTVGLMASSKLGDLSPDVMEQIISVVKESCKTTLDIVSDGSTELVVSYDIESGIGNTFEAVCGMVKDSMKYEKMP